MSPLPLQCWPRQDATWARWSAACTGPMRDTAARALARTGARPSALHNNCSGKHAGFVCFACGTDTDTAGYVSADHAVQRAVKATVEGLTGATLDAAHCGTDGCSIPTYAVSLRAGARFCAVWHGPWDGPRARCRCRPSAGRCRRASVHAGRDRRFDTQVMTLLGPRAFTKTGAEGVFCASFPELGLGITLKCEDGATRAAEVMMASLVARFVPVTAQEAATLDVFCSPAMHNWNGILTGHIAACGALAPGGGNSLKFL